MSKTKKVITKGPFDIPMPDSSALELERLLKTLPAECRKLRRKSATPDSAELIPGERADISMVSVESVDREGEVVLAKGLDMALFRLNPVVPFAHKYDELPIGKALWIKQVQGGIKAKTIYAEKPGDWQGPWMPDAVWAMTQQGIIKGKSIGFLPTKLRAPTKEEVSMNPSWKNANVVCESSVLLEYSIAPIPVNQDALVEAVAKGFKVEPAILEKLNIKAIELDKLAKAFKLPPEVLKAPAPKPKAKPRPDHTRLFLAELEKLQVDPEKIAAQVVAALANRGRV